MKPHTSLYDLWICNVQKTLSNDIQIIITINDYHNLNFQEVHKLKMLSHYWVEISKEIQHLKNCHNLGQPNSTYCVIIIGKKTLPHQRHHNATATTSPDPLKLKQPRELIFEYKQNPT